MEDGAPNRFHSLLTKHCGAQHRLPRALRPRSEDHFPHPLPHVLPFLRRLRRHSPRGYIGRGISPSPSPAVFVSYELE